MFEKEYDQTKYNLPWFVGVVHLGYNTNSEGLVRVDLVSIMASSYLICSATGSQLREGAS